VKPPPKLYSVTEVAELLSCSRGHVYSLIAAGQFSEVADISAGGSRAKTRISEPVLAAYIAARTRQVRP
jgi:excisionase family DNA binding protein